MKKIIKLIASCCLLFGYFSVSAQTDKYLQAGQIRSDQRQAIESEINDFVAKNLKQYRLTPEIISGIEEKLKEESDHEAIPKDALEATLLKVKKAELRKLYFTKHPDAQLYYMADNSSGTARQVCANGDFETPANIATDYTFWSDTNVNIDGCDTPSVLAGNAVAPTVNQLNTPVTIIDASAPGYVPNDPILAFYGQNVPTLPGGGGGGNNTCIKLNDSSTFGPGFPGGPNFTAMGGSDVTTMSRQIAITDATLEYEMSLMLQVSGHALTQQPFFRVNILDSGGNLVNQRCILAQPDCIFTRLQLGANPSANDIYFTGWICDAIDVSALIGQTATIEFTVSDCGGGIHYGTAYIDNICNYTCPQPAYGSLLLEPLDDACPDIIGLTPYNVCGDFFPPPGTTTPTYAIRVSTNGGPFVPITVTPTVTGTHFCFALDPSVFGVETNNQYTFEVTANYSQTCAFGTFNNSNTSFVDVTFQDCCYPTLITAATITDLLWVQRDEWIETTDFINNPLPSGSVVYHAGDYIEMNPGFETVFGSQYVAYIEDCTYNYAYKIPKAPQIKTLPTVGEARNNLIKIDDETIAIYPNPANSLLNISLANDGLQAVRITTTDGKAVWVGKASGHEHQIDVSSFANGIYIISIETSGGKTLNAKFIKS